jgi:hypothetical protein
LAPQSTPQSDHEIKYDGSKVLGSHVIRFGVAFNHLRGGGFASFFKNGPQIGHGGLAPDRADESEWRPLPGPNGSLFRWGASNPFNYPADSAATP